MKRVSIDVACQIMEGALFAPHLGEVFGPVSEDPDWHWVVFPVPEELGGGWVPCAWSQMEEVLMELDPNLCESFSEERIREVFRAVNGGFSGGALDQLLSVSQEIFARGAYHQLTPTGIFVQEDRRENHRQKNQVSMEMVQWVLKTPGMER